MAEGVYIIKCLQKCKLSKDKTMYKVYDSLGNLVRRFPTYRQASNYKFAYGNTGWTIK